MNNSEWKWSKYKIKRTTVLLIISLMFTTGIICDIFFNKTVVVKPTEIEKSAIQVKHEGEAIVEEKQTNKGLPDEKHEKTINRVPVKEKVVNTSRKVIEKKKIETSRKDMPLQRVSHDGKKAAESKVRQESLCVQSAESKAITEDEVKKLVPPQDDGQLFIAQSRPRRARPASAYGKAFLIVISGDHQKITVTEGDEVQGDSVMLNSSYSEKTLMIPRSRPVHFQISGSCNLVYVKQNRIFGKMTTVDVGKYNTFTGIPPT